jgi:predicted lipoprotein with Yx(FWY)xxD motif
MFSTKQYQLAGVALGALTVASIVPALAAEKGVEFSTPMGITLVDVTTGAQEFLWRRLGDEEGRPLYTYDADGRSGKSTCVGECAKEFPPYLAAPNAKAFGDWSIIRREDGGRQWAYQGQALYRFSGQDPTPKLKNRQEANAVAGIENGGLLDPASTDNSPKTGWRRAGVNLKISTPPDIVAKSLPTANGYGFASQSTGRILYTLRTSPKNPNAWVPAYAPQLARNIGDFTVITREDGKRQWAYQNKPLFSFREDYSASDINGLLEQKDAEVALSHRHYMPPEMNIGVLDFRGPIMTTSKGMTVYTQTRYKVQYGGRETRDGFRVPYAEAKVVNTKGCATEECLAQWKPVVAPANAQSSGFWEVMKREDGTRQWAYKGAALYTFVEDKLPGDDRGNNRHEVHFGDPEGKRDLALTGGDDKGATGSGFYWHIVTFTN